MDAFKRNHEAPPDLETETWRIDTAQALEISGNGSTGPIRAMRDYSESGPEPQVEYGLDEPCAPEEPGEWRLDPIRATRDGTESGPGPQVEYGFDESRGPEEPGEWHLDPIRATWDDGESGPEPQVDHGLDESRGPEEPGEWHLDPIRATRDDGDTGPEPQVEYGFDESRGPEEPGEWHLEPIPPTRDGTESGPEPRAGHDFGEAHGPEEFGERHPVQIRAARDGADADAVARATDELDDPHEAAASAESPPRSFDPRTLPPRRGAIRAAGTLLSVLALVGAGAAGGYLFWKTQLVRPALVRHLPAVPVAVADLAPVPDASAATGPTAEVLSRASTPPEAGTTNSVESGPVKPLSGIAGAGDRVPAAGGTEGVPARRAGSGPNSGGEGEARAAASVGTLMPDDAEAPGRASAVGLLAADAYRASTVSGRSSPEVPDDSRASLVAEFSAPADSTTVQRVSPSSDSMPAAAADVPVESVDPPESETKRNGMEPRQNPRTGIAVTKRVRANHVAASLERAYAAYRIGNVESAAEAYRYVLMHEPGNRDALLGLAAVAARAGRRDEAAAHYARVLASHPADTVAQAGLIALDERASARSESALKALLRTEPRAAHLHFDLGNVYASQSRWPEAQRAYFDAHRLDGDDADYAYNLAVSLDHLARPRGALDFYRKALALSRDRPAAFDDAAVRARIRDIDPSRTAGIAPRISFSIPAPGAR